MTHCASCHLSRHSHLEAFYPTQANPSGTSLEVHTRCLSLAEHLVRKDRVPHKLLQKMQAVAQQKVRTSLLPPALTPQLSRFNLFAH